MKKNYYILIAALALLFSSSIFAQTNSSLEMTGSAAANGMVCTYTTNMQKNTNNPTSKTFAAYNTPSPIDGKLEVIQQQFPGANPLNSAAEAIFLGDTSNPPYVLMSSLGNASTNPNPYFTNLSSPAGQGIDGASNHLNK
ncbi:hypothetical protein [Chryseobacterium pennipullorum]|uniref:Uncharacterized protein n=1 Tax=Chryseobacterium pennipullorum TaxID=2258963 RepID=A0A3D9B004_9FLAO|nr:hypothetical protein [Chryseobacterium pennipullorum]REC46950.1 hypothetical protein DRF67_12030 [Chryseobacterium pennipullorum]